MNTPFQGANIGGIEVKNRIFRSATHESMTESGGLPGKAMEDLYRDLADGGVGLIITGFLSFSGQDNPSGRTLLIGDDEKIPALKKLTGTVHDHGSRVVAQLAHVGSQLTHAPAGEVFAPSDVVDPINGIKPTPFSKEQIKTLVKEFAGAALRAKKAGFDGVQLHGAHGYLLSKFLSPVFNKRDDEYGGSPIKNVRVIVEILEETKAVCGADFPVWIKLNASDFGKEDRFFTFEDCIVASRELEKSGIDAIELSGGTMAGAFSPARGKKHAAYHVDYAKKLKREVGVPVISVGGIKSIDVIEKIFSETDIDAVSMCRPLIREPGLIKRWMEGDRKDAACVACNGCFNPKGIKCFFHLEEGDEKNAQKEVIKFMSSMGGDS